MRQRLNHVRVILLILIFMIVVQNTQAQRDNATYCIRCGIIYDVAWNPNSDRLAVGASDGLWLYTRTGATIAHLSNDVTRAVGWSANADLLASAYRIPNGDPRRLRIWDVNNKRLLQELPTSASHISFNWNPVSNLLAYADGYTVALWDADANTVLHAENLQFEPLQGNGIWSIPVTYGAVLVLAWSPDGTHLAVSARTDLVNDTAGFREIPNGFYNTTFIWNSINKTVERSFPRAASDASDNMNWDPTGRYIMITYRDGSFTHLIDTKTGQLADLEMKATRVFAWSPDGDYVATDGSDPGSPNTISIWRLKPLYPYDFEPVSFLSGHSAEITTIDWSPDGKWIASGSLDGTVRIWAAPDKL